MSVLRDVSGGVLRSQNHEKSAAAVATDPGGDVRGNIARLTARARQLLADDTDTRVVRNGLSAYETSRKVAADVSARARAPGQAGATQASVELFMASLGFNLQEQQRLLQQLQASQGPLTATGDVGAAAKTSGAFFHGQVDDELGSTLESFVANRRHEIMRRSMDEMHCRVEDLVQERSEIIIRASWERCCKEVADVFESFSLKAGGGGGEVARGKMSTTGVNPAGTVRPRAGVMALLNGRDAASMRILNKIAGFARIVDTQPPLQWVRCFAAHVADDAPFVTDEVALLWTTVEQILQPILQLGSASTNMTFVASSRHMMERKALVSVLSRVLKVEPERFGELENMHATRFISIMGRYTSSANPWAHIYTAMRCGRYDAAAIVANNAGFRLVEAKLEAYANAHTTQRSTLPPAVELRSLYEEEATRADPYRQIVLLLLLVGNTGESSDVVLSAVASLSSKVARSLEDALWIRLFCVRSVELQDGNKLQSLAEMQRLLLDDMQELVELVRGDVVRLASLLIHALLPSSGLRLLIEGDNTYVDGVHLAMCFHNSNLLPCGDVEVPVDLSRLIPQYCSLVLLDADKRHACAAYAGAAVFRYFLRTNLVDAFVEYCGNELVCVKLFGQRGGSRVSSDGVLLQEPPSPELLEAMERVAEAGAARGQAEIAVHVFSVLERAAALVKDDARADYALSRALQIICPALSHAFQQTPSGENTSLFMHAAALQERVACSERVVPHACAEAFQILCKMGEVFLGVARGELEVALRCFWSLPFIPTTAEDIERCAELLDTATESIATAVPPILLLVMQSMLKLAEVLKSRGQTSEAAQMQRRAQTLTMWVRRWKRLVSRQLIDELTSLERLLAL
ncbi:putative nucleoporin interacting component (NUP93) [Trypanosoma conorhini]|uniref:Nuclear pore protein n=1 Tax=Trypanosoma conorhini TaxID=83891 RepID=A0A3R7M4T3_9TRYP|nr:putative nucleoporin interacting component (NUP93) [Trypanosoma conorhini]RNF26571.1 putative nucleoporin interacting component (NUP93) [Trypanosoma conorhini]